MAVGEGQVDALAATLRGSGPAVGALPLFAGARAQEPASATVEQIGLCVDTAIVALGPAWEARAGSQRADGPLKASVAAFAAVGRVQGKVDARPVAGGFEQAAIAAALAARTGLVFVAHLTAGTAVVRVGVRIDAGSVARGLPNSATPAAAEPQ